MSRRALLRGAVALPLLATPAPRAAMAPASPSGDGADAMDAAGTTADGLPPQAGAPAQAPAPTPAAETLLPPGIVPRPGLASPTRVPWVNANGWRFLRHRRGKFAYEQPLPAGKAALAAAEAAAYGADVALPIDPADQAALDAMRAFLASLPTPPADLGDVADFGVMDDGSFELGEVMNLFVRRNLLFRAMPAKSRIKSPFALTVQLGTRTFPREEAADPSALALKVRRQLTDAKRSLRLYGSEVVIARWTAGAAQARLHLLNYGQREIQGLRVRVRGTYPTSQVYVASVPSPEQAPPGQTQPGQTMPQQTTPEQTKPGPAKLEEVAVAGGFTEFTVPGVTTYAVIDLASR